MAAGRSPADPSHTRWRLEHQWRRSPGGRDRLGAIAAAFTSIWVANHLDDTISRLDPSTGRVEATVEVHEGPNALAATADTLWVGNEFGDSISSIDPASNTGATTLPVGGATASLAVEGDGLWLAVGASASEHRGGTLVASWGAPPDTLDPAVVYASLGWYILAVTNDGLVGYKKVGGPDGATLVPDLASALPEVSPDELTYRFPLREGIRYSTGEPVLPEDFRHGLERAIALSGDAATLFGSLDGARSCSKDPATCDLSSSIVVDDGSVTYHLARPDPDLPLKLALPFAFPVPLDIPIEDQGMTPVPATGPYMISEAGPDGIELVRNPEFEEWSGAAQPDGFADAISIELGHEVTTAFDLLEAGEIDLMLDPPTQEDLATLRSTHPEQVVAWPNPFTLMVGFDVLQSPLDDERVRRALSLALDRERIVELLGGSATNRVTCQILPPNFQGSAPFCPHTLEPEGNVWSGPDVATARALIDEAGAVGEPVTVTVTDAEGYLPPGSVEVMRYVTDVLNELGLRAELEIVRDGDAYFGEQYEEPAGTQRHPQVFMSGWISDYLGAANFIDLLFRCASPSNVWGWCDPAMDAQMDEALALYATDPGESNRTWTDIEHQLVELAVVAPLSNPLTTYAVSARTENVQVHPQWGILLNRLWVR